MATELAVQSERAYQKQPHIFVNSKLKSGKTKRVGKGGRRWFKDVGLGFRTPKNAIEGNYIGRSSPSLPRHDLDTGNMCWKTCDKSLEDMVGTVYGTLDEKIGNDGL